MPIIEGTSAVKSIVAEYDFAKDGGAIGDISLRGATLPAGSVVIGGWVEGDDVLTSGGAATVGLGIEAANDLDGPIAFNTGWGAATEVDAPIAFASVSITSGPLPRTTAPRVPKLRVNTAALTGGKFTITILYV